MKTVGIIGGVGPETTSEFYLELIFGCYQKNKEQRPPILIWNLPLLYKIEEDLLEKSKGEERYIPYLIDAAKLLENAGADFLVMPCNSLHAFIADIRRAVKIPVLSIVEETAKFLKSNKIKQVGVLATTSTLNKKLYEGALKREDIKQVVPDDFEQAKIGKTISNIVLNRHANKDRQELINIINSFEKKGVKDVILACTDLQLLIPTHSKLNIHDTMKILADATIDNILSD
jgi:aspartate racemase